MSPGEVVKTGELNVYQGQLFHVGFQGARLFFVSQLCFTFHGAQKAQAKLVCCVQLADRKPFTGGPLDPRLVGSSQHDRLASVSTCCYM